MMAEAKRKTKPKAETEGGKGARGFVIDSDDPETVASKLSARLPEWEGMRQIDRDALIKQSISSRHRPARAKVGADKDPETGAFQITPPKKDQGSHALRIYETFATTSEDFVSARLSEIARHFSGGGREPTEIDMSAILAYVGGCAPENEQQAALATQMALINDAASTALSKAMRAEYMDNYEKHSNVANKLARTLAALTDSYSKLQRGGVQTVKHINVYQGGQAVVTDSIQTGGANVRTTNRAHATIHGAAMLGHDPQGCGVPIASGQGEAPMSNAWLCEGQRSAEGQQQCIEARPADHDA